MTISRWVKAPIDSEAALAEASGMAQTPLQDRPGRAASALTSQNASPRTRTHQQPQAIITREGERELRATLARLRHELDVDFVARLNDSRAFGEAGNNDEYLQILEEEAVLASRVARLERLLESASVLDPGVVGATAAVGMTVRVEDLHSGAVEQIRLVGDYEPAGGDAVSASSPVGRALIGQAVGAEVEVELPRGRERALRIVSLGASAPS